MKRMDLEALSSDLGSFFTSKRALCHYLCWMAPFMVLGNKLRRLLHVRQLRLTSEKEACEFLLKMYLATDDNREEMRRHLTEFQRQAQQKLMLFNMFQKELQALVNEHSNHRQLLRVLELGLRQAKLYVEWSNEMLEDLK